MENYKDNMKTLQRHNKDTVKKLRKRLTSIFLIMLILMAALSSAAAVRADESSETATGSADSKSDSDILYSYLEGKRAGAMTGTPQDGWIREHVTDGEMLYYNSLPDELVALTESKIDYFIIPTVNYSLVMDNYPLTCQTDVVATEQGVSFIMAQNDEGEALQTELNTYIRELSDSGKLKELQDYWLFSDEEKSPVDIPSSGENGNLKLATTSSLIPYDYKIDGEFAGFEIDILAGFCKQNGYGLKIYDMDFSGILSGVTAGKYDLGCGGVSATAERRKSVYFCDYTYVQSFQVVMRAADVPEGVGISYQSEEASQQTLLEKLYNNFIAENRWQLFIQGALVTIGITALAAIFGTILGFFICKMRISRNKAASLFARGYIYILSGLPQVLLLIIFCFIIFASTDLPGFWVAAIAFSFNFSATFATLLKSGIETVDIGQTEAALTLGYTEKAAFNKIVIPQAFKNCVGVYHGQIINLLKATSVVGYIAVQDLTKVADIIRSRTFDAFIPVIFAGILYFVLAAILIRVVTWLNKKLMPFERDPRKGSMLKGVKIR